jgi:hypothetical protein
MKVRNLFHALAITVAMTGIGAMAPDSASAVAWSCNVFSVLEFPPSSTAAANPRVGVLCSNPIVVNNGGTNETIFWLGVASSNAAATRFMTLANAALLSGKPLVVDIPATHNGVNYANPPGCARADCRMPTLYSINF